MANLRAGSKRMNLKNQEQIFVENILSEGKETKCWKSKLSY